MALTTLNLNDLYRTMRASLLNLVCVCLGAWTLVIVQPAIHCRVDCIQGALRFCYPASKSNSLNASEVVDMHSISPVMQCCRFLRQLIKGLETTWRNSSCMWQHG